LVEPAVRPDDAVDENVPLSPVVVTNP